MGDGEGADVRSGGTSVFVNSMRREKRGMGCGNLRYAYQSLPHLGFDLHTDDSRLARIIYHGFGSTTIVIISH